MVSDMTDKDRELNPTRKFFTLCIIIVVVLGTSCVSPNTTSDFDLRKFQVLPINTYYDEAHNIALGWDAGAYPSYVFATFAMPDDNDDTLLISYGFRSHAVPSKWLMIVFSKIDPSNPKITNGEYPAGVDRPLTQEIEIKNLSLDSLDMLAIAYQNGGSDFLRDNKSINADSFVSSVALVL